MPHHGHHGGSRQGGGGGGGHHHHHHQHHSQQQINGNNNCSTVPATLLFSQMNRCQRNSEFVVPDSHCYSLEDFQCSPSQGKKVVTKTERNETKKAILNDLETSLDKPEKSRSEPEKWSIISIQEKNKSDQETPKQQVKKKNLDEKKAPHSHPASLGFSLPSRPPSLGSSSSPPCSQCFTCVIL